jgi:hypothetical protein
VSVSLGSARRDKVVHAEFLGVPFVIERRGTNGDLQAAAELIASLDGQVAAIGLGGIDLYLVAGERRYVVRDALRLARQAPRTPVVDGSGLKNTLERETIRRLWGEGQLVAADDSGRLPRFLVVSAVDRFGMAEAVAETGCEYVFGDVIFALKLPFPVKRLSHIRRLAQTLLPFICPLPFKLIYPTGDQQQQPGKTGRRWLQWADIIGGDYHFIGRNLPAATRHHPRPLQGKTIITNTTTEADMERLRELGLSQLVTTTPRLGGTIVWDQCDGRGAGEPVGETAGGPD